MVINGERDLPPFVWPSPEVQNDLLVLNPDVSPHWLFESAEAVLGITQGMTMAGTKLLESTARERPGQQGRLIVTLYPACPTDEQVLGALKELQQSSQGLWEFRLLLVDCLAGAPANITCWVTGQDATISIGPTPNFGWSRPDPAQLNLVFRADPVLLERWRQWFDLVWLRASPLNDKTSGIPPLVPASGTAEAARLWRQYEGLCTTQEQPEVTVIVDAETGKTTVITPNGDRESTPSETLGVPTLDPLAQRVASIYELGDLVSVDTLSRIPPLDVPAKAAWFDVQSTRQAGAVKREIRLRISAFEPRVLQDINNKRTIVNHLLQRLSFSLGEGLRWMPKGAYPLFCAEMERVNLEGTTMLKGAVGGTPNDFLGRQSDRIFRDANLIYQEFHPGRQISTDAMIQIMDELSKRLQRAMGERFLPQVSRSRLTFNPQQSSNWVSVWGQPLALLESIAEFPRRCLADAYFMRGLKVDRDELLAAMDVCHDPVLKEHDIRRAEVDLALIGQIGRGSLEPRKKCWLLLQLIEGTPISDLEKQLAGEE